MKPEQLDVFLLEDSIWVAAALTGVSRYDFPFENFFACRHPWQRPESITAIGRFGVMDDYEKLFQQLEETGVSLIHSPSQHLVASDLQHWYPLLHDLTPRSQLFASPPTVEEVTRNFDWPVFLKGSRQTSRHQASLSVVRSPDEYVRAIEHYQNDPILHWQPLVIREFIHLRSVVGKQTEKIPPSFEFRTFWWRRQCVGAGAYWADFAAYQWTQDEMHDALAVAQEAANRLALPFLVVDVAQTEAGNWIVIECNDAQESGYAGIAAVGLWQKIIDLERKCEVTN